MDSAAISSAWRTPESLTRAAYAQIADAGVEAVIARADVVFGCLDLDLPRLHLTQLCAQFGRTLFELASDLTGNDDELHHGGRVVLCDGNRCLAGLGPLGPARDGS